jgi:excisionase family DNA binding protein
MEMKDYRERRYLSAIEAAKYLKTNVKTIHALVKRKAIGVIRAASGQMRFDIEELERYRKDTERYSKVLPKPEFQSANIIEANNSTHKVYIKSSIEMSDISDNSVNLMITSPPYFNAKMYSREPIEGDLGNIHNIDEWFEKIEYVWREVFRVLQPGRKAFINIMNLPIREKNGFRTLNLVGRTIDLYEKVGFIFKRDIVWHKTNAVRAHFGTYPYPGGILINNMHEFILEFDKPEQKGFNKYKHLTKEQRERSKLEKDFWLSIKKSDVWTMKPQGSGDRRNHVAPFPYELPLRIIKAFSYIGETVLDPFLGSGTTLIVARDLERNGIGYEINPEIAKEAIRAIKTYQHKFSYGIMDNE